jgi:hypothetical protein
MLEFMVESRDPSLLCATSSCAQKKGQRGSRSDEAALTLPPPPTQADFPQFSISKELSVSQNLLPVSTHATLSLLVIVHIRQGTQSIRSNKTQAETPVCRKAVHAETPVCQKAVQLFDRLGSRHVFYVTNATNQHWCLDRKESPEGRARASQMKAWIGSTSQIRSRQ